jgi:hypothetical protein
LLLVVVAAVVAVVGEVEDQLQQALGLKRADEQRLDLHVGGLGA